jgi:hypothetical protein
MTKIDDGYGFSKRAGATKVLYMAGVLTIVNRGIVENKKEDPTPFTLTCVEM